MDMIRSVWRPRFWIFFPILIIVVIVVFWCFYQPHTTVLLLRHADRLGSEDLLNDAGVDRAAELIHVGEKADINAIFHSEASRTQRTAQDLADHLGITPTQINSADVSGIVTEILNNHAGETVLVVSHSNRVPDIIEAFGGPQLPDIDHEEYDNLFVLNTCRCWWKSTSLINLQYGAVSP